jgi:hypothetical protein
MFSKWDPFPVMLEGVMLSAFPTSWSEFVSVVTSCSEITPKGSPLLLMLPGSLVNSLAERLPEFLIGVL